MLEYFPALEAAFDYSKKAPLILLSGYQTPETIRRIGTEIGCLAEEARLPEQRNVARKAVEAANAQHTVLPTETVAAQLVAAIAGQITADAAAIAQLDEQIQTRFEQHRNASILVSMPGFGVILAATFLANTGGDLTALPDRRPARQRRRTGTRATGFRPDNREQPPAERFSTGA